METVNPEAVFTKLGNQIELANVKINSLSALLQDMKKAGENVFTSEEIELTQRVLTETMEENERAKSELAVKIDIYEKQVVFMQDQLEKRQKIIEAFEQSSNVDDNDPLFDLLVKTHARISADHKAASEKIY